MISTRTVTFLQLTHPRHAQFNRGFGVTLVSANSCFIIFCSFFHYLIFLSFFSYSNVYSCDILGFVLRSDVSDVRAEYCFLVG